MNNFGYCMCSDNTKNSVSEQLTIFSERRLQCKFRNLMCICLSRFKWKWLCSNCSIRYRCTGDIKTFIILCANVFIFKRFLITWRNSLYTHTFIILDECERCWNVLVLSCIINWRLCRVDSQGLWTTERVTIWIIFLV